MSNIMKELLRCKREGRSGVLATIIQVEGSAYQKEGTKCFYSEDGILTGILSGGCVEQDIEEHAKDVLQQRKPRTIFYDFRGEASDLWGLGVGCNGAIQIFLELYDPIQQPDRSELIEMSVTRLIREAQTVVTIIDGPDHERIGEKWLASERRDLSLAGWKFFHDRITPVPKLLVFGAGPDAVPVVKGAKELGWHVTVADHRPGYLHQPPFGSADQLVHTPAGKAPAVELDSHTFVVIMSHHFEQDQLMLTHVLSSDVSYIGVLGPRHRTQRMLEPMECQWNTAKLKRIHSPIGLDIGSKTPEEIALSILSELTACYRGAMAAASLKEKAGEFHWYASVI